MDITRKQRLHLMLTGDDEGRLCKDIPEAACNHQSGNFLIHVFSLAATKTGDGLSNPKLVLSWLLTALGAPAFFVGLLVPIREAGALLPQLAIAAAIRRQPIRKTLWAWGSVVQGLAIAGMALAALFLQGEKAGWAIVILLLVFSLARGICSVSYKDVLGKTVSKSTRGTATGTASTIAAMFVLLFGLLLSTGFLERSVPVITGALIAAACLWVIASTLFIRLEEDPGATEGGRNAVTLLKDHLSYLTNDKQLQFFLLTRALLTSTALAPPFLIILFGSNGTANPSALGYVILASALASLLSSYIWGRLSDKSSRRVLMLAGLIAGAALSIAPILGSMHNRIFDHPATLPSLLFILMVSYEGVRLGRATHLVDMTRAEKRAVYTALSNTLIGIVLFLSAGFGLVAQVFGEAVVLITFAVMAFTATITASKLKDVQAT